MPNVALLRSDRETASIFRAASQVVSPLVPVTKANVDAFAQKLRDVAAKVKRQHKKSKKEVLRCFQWNVSGRAKGLLPEGAWNLAGGRA